VFYSHLKSDGLFYDNSVPFSCCDRDALRPCIHESVTSSDAHFAYDVAHDLTIYTKGCAVVLAQIIADNILGRIGTLGLMLLAIEVRLGLLLTFSKTVSNMTLGITRFDCRYRLHLQ